MKMMYSSDLQEQDWSGLDVIARSIWDFALDSQDHRKVSALLLLHCGSELGCVV